MVSVTATEYLLIYYLVIAKTNSSIADPSAANIVLSNDYSKSLLYLGSSMCGTQVYDRISSDHSRLSRAT